MPFYIQIHSSIQSGCIRLTLQYFFFFCRQHKYRDVEQKFRIFNTFNSYHIFLKSVSTPSTSNDAKCQLLWTLLKSNETWHRGISDSALLIWIKAMLLEIEWIICSWCISIWKLNNSYFGHLFQLQKQYLFRCLCKTTLHLSLEPDWNGISRK